MTIRNVAETKRQLSALLGRVAASGETVLITRRGKPMAKLVPVEAAPSPTYPFAGFQGWLEDDDPFFTAVNEATAARASHRPRMLAIDPLE
jgi:prevent-host-death family protein